MADHKTLSPPPPALQYGWKNATSNGRFPSVPAEVNCFFLCCIQSRIPHSSTTKQTHKIPLRNNAGINNEHSNLKQAEILKYNIALKKYYIRNSENGLEVELQGVQQFLEFF